MQQAPNVEYYALVFGDHGGGFSVTSDFCGDLLEYQRKNYLYLKNNGYNTDGNEHYDYNLTDISKLDAAFAALKKVTDFLVKQDVSNVDAYIKAACSCYQFYNKEPFYDVVSSMYSPTMPSTPLSYRRQRLPSELLSPGMPTTVMSLTPRAKAWVNW